MHRLIALCLLLSLPATAIGAESDSGAHLFLRASAGAGYSSQHWDYYHPLNTTAVAGVLAAHAGVVLANRFAVGGFTVFDPQFNVSGRQEDTGKRVTASFMPWVAFGGFGAWLPNDSLTAGVELGMCYGGKYMVEGGVGFESAASVVWKFLPLGPVALGLFGRGGIDLLTDTSSGETGRHAFIGAGLAAERR